MENEKLLVGYARRTITPKMSVPLAGYGATHKRMSEFVQDDLYLTCIAFTQGDETVLLCTHDLIHTIPKWARLVRERVSPKTGIPAEHMFFCSTHTHSAPDIVSTLPCMEEYLADYVDAAEEAIMAALEDRAPGSFFGTRTEVPMNRVRHYILENGTYAGSNLGDFNSAPIAGHAEPNDPEMLLVKVAREEKPDILIVNYQVHPTSASLVQKDMWRGVSADFIASLRNNVEDVTGMHVAYFTGAAGNQVMGSKIPEERGNMSPEGFQRYGGGHKIVYGWRMAQYIYEALPTMQPMEGDGISTAQVMLQRPVNHDDEEFADVAKQAVEIWHNEGVVAGHKFAREHGLASSFHANAVLNRLTRPQVQDMELNAVRVGPLAFTTLPYETFASHGVYIKEHSPFPMTMIFSCTNGAWSYVPTEKAYDFKCYEACISYFSKGTGEVAAEKLVEMLGQLK